MDHAACGQQHPGSHDVKDLKLTPEQLRAGVRCPEFLLRHNLKTVSQMQTCSGKFVDSPRTPFVQERAAERQ